MTTAAYFKIGEADIKQTSQSVTLCVENYPIIRNLRYNLETIRPELRQYIVESDLGFGWEMGAPLIGWKEHRFVEDDDSETDDGDETDDDDGVPAVGSTQMSAAASLPYISTKSR